VPKGTPELSREELTAGLSTSHSQVLRTLYSSASIIR
jgi:hypothetical protein